MGKIKDQHLARAVAALREAQLELELALGPTELDVQLVLTSCSVALRKALSGQHMSITRGEISGVKVMVDTLAQQLKRKAA